MSGQMIGRAGLIQALGLMTEITRILLPICIALAACGLALLFGQKDNRQFAVGSLLLFLAAFGANIFLPNAFIVGQPVFWQFGYATVFPLLSMLYVIAHMAIWRSFAKPKWLAFVSALLPAWFFASAGFWEVIA